MKCPSCLLLLPLVFTACTSVKVNRLTEEKLPKVPAKQVQQVTADEIKGRAIVKLAEIEMSTRSPFAADLNALARQRTGKLGGEVYRVTASAAQTTVTASLLGLFGDKSSASMSIEALHWKDAPASTKPAAAPQPVPPRKTKAWWRPWSWF